MKLTILRYDFQEQFTRGLMFLNTQFMGHTIEPYYPNYDLLKSDADLIALKAKKTVAIREGLYPASLFFSPKFQMTVVSVQNVKGFSDIEIHLGNYANDTHGCCLIGETANFNGNILLCNSRVALNRLTARVHELLKPNEGFTVEYTSKLFS